VVLRDFSKTRQKIRNSPKESHYIVKIAYFGNVMSKVLQKHES